MIYGLDLHPQFQQGIPIEQLPPAGVSFIICKLSEGTDSGSYSGSIDFIRRGRACNMACAGYHYLDSNDPVGQARTFADACHVAGVRGCLDVEQGSGDINNVRTFLSESAQLGNPIALLYLPHWYWQQIGSPDLTGLPPLWSSKYPDMTQGDLTQNFARTPANYWDGHGGLSVEVLQFSSSVIVVGHGPVDANAYPGSLVEFSNLINGVSSAPTTSPKPATHLIDDGEFMYVMTQPPPMTEPLIAMWSGPIFIGLDTKGEKDDALANIAKGAMVQWVEKSTWDRLAQWSHNMCDKEVEPSTSVTVTPTPSAIPPIKG